MNQKATPFERGKTLQNFAERQSEQRLSPQVRLIFRHRRKMTLARKCFAHTGFQSGFAKVRTCAGVPPAPFCTPVPSCFYLQNTAHAQAFSLFPQNGGHAPPFCTIENLRCVNFLAEKRWVPEAPCKYAHTKRNGKVNFLFPALAF